MFYVTAERPASQHLRPESTRFREFESFQGSVQQMPTHVPRDGSSLLLNPAPYLSAYASPEQYFSAGQSNAGTRGAIPRSRSYLDVNNSADVQGTFPSLGHHAHQRYPDTHHHTAPSDELSYSSQLSQPLMPTLPQLGRDDLTGNLDISNLIPNYSPEPPSTVATSPSTHSSPSSSEAWKMPPPEVEQPEPSSRPRKPRREKPRIELSPDQPPTTQGKPRARVYVACIQCRTRKIRCDGAKPVCHNCGRRSNGNGECTYDAAPKRRGPDKTPGARQRMARDVRNEIDGSIGPTRRQRRRREDDATKSESQSIGLTGGSTSDTIRYGGQHVPSSWPLCLSPISPMSADTYRSPQDYHLPVQNATQHGTKLAHSIDCGCPAPSYNQDFSTRSDSLYVSRGMPQVQDYDPYAQEFNATSKPYVAIAQRGFDDSVDGSDNTLTIPPDPSVDFPRKVWWDSLLYLYGDSGSHNFVPLAPSQRKAISRAITDDLRFLFKSSNHWFSFLHVQTFFSNYFDPHKRELIQPSLILSALALASFWQSSEYGNGASGRERALKLRDEAQGALESSINARWIDDGLAQAAWLLALFEVSGHPLHSTQRARSSLVMLDSILRSLSLTTLDVGNQNVSVFSPRSVPIVPSSLEQMPQAWSLPKPTSLTCSPIDVNPTLNPSVSHSSQLDSTGSPFPTACPCKSLSLGEHQPRALEQTPLWAASPAWEKSMSEAEIRKESCRRLCWSSVALAAGHVSYATANHDPGPELFVADPANYALLFSGESITRSSSGMFDAKATVWALYDRSALLWHSCVRMRHDRAATEQEKSHFAFASWFEADAIETALNKHTCDLERSFLFVGREHLFNTRMYITHEFQQSVPLVNSDGLFHRKKAEDWLTHQADAASRLMGGLRTVTGLENHVLAQRPFYMFWFMGQVSRALNLWDCDHSLTVALDVCKSLVPPIEYLMALWPCEEQRKRYEALRERLVHALVVAGMPPLSPLNLTLAELSSSII